MKAKIFNRLFILSLIIIAGIGQVAANTTTVKGKVTDSKNHPIEFATATLISPLTNEIVKGEVCNEKGEFAIAKVEPGEYILSVSMLGYNKYETEKMKLNGKPGVIVKEIILKESTEMLQDVVVTAKKQFIEQSVDKMVINPEASITSASENVYDILKKLPGVTVDNSDNISLKGMQGVKVLIDDKPTYVSASQLASLLKGMQAKNVDKIEIIENPSARYDAEGNSGIINIKTKHNKTPGFNGSVNAGVTMASKFGWNGSLDLNMKYDKFNLYGNYSNYNWAGTNSMDASRRFTSTSLAGAYQLIDNDGEYDGSSHNYKFGLDYYIAKNHVLSAMFRGNSGSNENTDKSSTDFADKYKNIDSTLISSSTSENRWRNATYNLNYKWDIDSTGQSLSFDADYAWFKFNSPDNQDGKYYDSQQNDLHHDLSVEKNQGSDIKILTSKLDYVLPVGKNLNFEAGLKASFVNTDSYMDMSGYMNQHDHFTYKEDIQAAYINARAQLKKTTLQLGLRLENTISKGTSVYTNQVNDTSYLKLFPSFFVQQQLTEKHSLNLKYSYRIGRPSYHNLNPFKWMVDPYTYNVGNPNLRPQFTHSAGISHNYKNALITSVGVNYTKGMFTEIIRQNDEEKTVYQTNENLSNSVDMNISETFQFQPTKWWHLNGTITGMYKTIRLEDGNTETLDMPSFIANMSNNFNLPYKVDMEISANYMSKQLISNIIILPRYTIDLGFQKKVLKDQGIVKLSVSDIFKTANGGAYARHDNVDIDVMNHWDSRKVNLTFSYRFGKDNFKTRSNRSTSSSEEQNRSNK
ncbi:MAG: TonB-dependent receptor [Bacteroidetes bacterium]|nr:TonB-dependent receptor [Bacteroidota bacterium]